MATWPPAGCTLLSPGAPDSALQACFQCFRCMWMAARLFHASPFSGSSCELRVKALRAAGYSFSLM